ncbi:hypothetical protein [Anaerocolumna xylanovorans]|nr:hypothetical protein [Anaerocolumna xylanovorans]
MQGFGSSKPDKVITLTVIKLKLLMKCFTLNGLNRTENIAWFILAYSIVLCIGMVLDRISYEKIKEPYNKAILELNKGKY